MARLATTLPVMGVPALCPGMCGRTSLYLPQSVVESRFDAEAVEPLEPRYNIAPSQDLPVITNEKPRAIDQFEWGFLPEWAEDPEESFRPINARSETVAEKPMFEKAFETKRCLVLADGFYEWQETGEGSKQPYRIQRADEQPFAMAGLWSEWSENGSGVQTVTILTTDSNHLLDPIHDRMPVILPEAVERDWLDVEAETDELLRPYPEDDLDAYPISRAVNDPGNDTPEILDPTEVDSTTQQGLDEFT